MIIFDTNKNVLGDEKSGFAPWPIAILFALFTMFIATPLLYTLIWVAFQILTIGAFGGFSAESWWIGFGIFVAFHVVFHVLCMRFPFAPGKNLE